MQLRHGDVQLIRVDSIPKEAKLLSGRKTLAEGEVTGHSHRVDVGDLFKTKNGELFLKVDSLSTVTHEEHKPINLQPGIYRIGIKRQFIPAGWESIKD